RRNYGAAGMRGDHRGYRELMPDPVSWLQIEQGWPVFTAEGTEIGFVSEVLADEQADIFDGLAIRVGRSGPTRYVPSEQGGDLFERHVTLSLTEAQAEQLDPYDGRPG